MTIEVVSIPGENLTSWDGFHDTFAKVLGFPDYYGRNMSAWVDCMTCVDDNDPQSDVRVEQGGFLVMSLSSADHFKERAPEIWEALNECTAFVNYRRIEKGEPPVLALSYYV